MGKNLKGCFMHESDHWQTPKEMYEWFVKECNYYDPCPYKCNEFDGLTIEWPKNVFINPPYSQVEKWVDKAIKEHHRQYDSDIILLLPVRTDTKWFAKLLEHATEITFITGRLHFNESKNSAPFPSMLVELYYGSEPKTIKSRDRDYYKRILK